MASSSPSCDNSAFFKDWTALNVDTLHMSVFLNASDATLEAYIDVMMLSEEIGDLADLEDILVMIFLPKSDGDKRPIGLYSASQRICFVTAGQTTDPSALQQVLFTQLTGRSLPDNLVGQEEKALAAFPEQRAGAVARR